jgi:hypothetical protein
MTRLQLWSCGGGRQSAGIAALMLEGQLPVPDHACMVRLEWEVGTVWPYVEAYLVPALQRLGVPFTAIDRRKYATKAFWGGSDGETILLPAYTDQSGAPSKLPEFCSGEWKREVVLRWAALQPGWKARGVDGWVGIDFGSSGGSAPPAATGISPATRSYSTARPGWAAASPPSSGRAGRRRRGRAATTAPTRATRSGPN